MFKKSYFFIVLFFLCSLNFLDAISQQDRDAFTVLLEHGTIPELKKTQEANAKKILELEKKIRLKDFTAVPERHEYIEQDKKLTRRIIELELFGQGGRGAKMLAEKEKEHEKTKDELTKEQQAHVKTKEELAQEKLQYQQEKQEHLKTKDELTQEKLQHEAEKQGHLKTKNELVTETQEHLKTKDELTQEKLQHEAEKQGHIKTKNELVTETQEHLKTKDELTQEKLQHEAEKQGHIKTKNELTTETQEHLKTKDELTQEKLQHEAEKQGHIKTKNELTTETQENLKTKDELTQEKLQHEAEKQGHIKTKNELTTETQEHLKTKGELTQEKLQHEAEKQGHIKTKNELTTETQEHLKTKDELTQEKLQHEAEKQGHIKTKNELTTETQEHLKTKDEKNKLKLAHEEELTKTKEKGNTPLHTAIESGNYEEIRKLIVDEKADVNAQNADGNTPLIMAAKLYGDVKGHTTGTITLDGVKKILNFLVKTGKAQKTITNNFGKNAYYYVNMANADKDTADQDTLDLLNPGVKIKEQKKKGPFDDALRLGEKITKQDLENKDEDGNNILHAIIDRFYKKDNDGNFEVMMPTSLNVINDLIAKFGIALNEKPGLIEQKNKNEETPLHTLLGRPFIKQEVDNVRIADHLLKFIFDLIDKGTLKSEVFDIKGVNRLSDDGKSTYSTEQTPFFLAVQNQPASLVKDLVMKKADVTAKDHWGYTALHELARREKGVTDATTKAAYWETIKAVLTGNKDALTITNNAGETPYGVAVGEDTDTWLQTLLNPNETEDKKIEAVGIK